MGAFAAMCAAQALRCACLPRVIRIAVAIGNLPRHFRCSPESRRAQATVVTKPRGGAFVGDSKSKIGTSFLWELWVLIDESNGKATGPGLLRQGGRRRTGPSFE
jgi:hypothetical protein